MKFFFFSKRRRNRRGKLSAKWSSLLFARRSLFDLPSSTSIPPSTSNRISTRCPRNEKKGMEGASLPFRPFQKCPPPPPRRPKREARRPSLACPCRRPVWWRLILEFSLVLCECFRSGLVFATSKSKRLRETGEKTGALSCALNRRLDHRPSTSSSSTTAFLLSSHLRRRGPCLRRRWRRRAVDLHLALVRRHFDEEARERTNEFEGE